MCEPERNFLIGDGFVGPRRYRILADIRSHGDRLGCDDRCSSLQTVLAGSRRSRWSRIRSKWFGWCKPVNDKPCALKCVDGINLMALWHQMLSINLIESTWWNRLDGIDLVESTRWYQWNRFGGINSALSSNRMESEEDSIAPDSNRMNAKNC